MTLLAGLCVSCSKKPDDIASSNIKPTGQAAAIPAAAKHDAERAAKPAKRDVEPKPAKRDIESKPAKRDIKPKTAPHDVERTAKEDNAPGPEPKKPWPAWKENTISDLYIEQGSSTDLAGWNPTSHAFALCHFECEDRQSSHELECYLGVAGTEVIDLDGDASEEEIVKAGILKTPDGDVDEPFGAVTLETRFKQGKKKGHCSWSLIASMKGGKKKRILASGGVEEDCYDKPYFQFFVSPDRKAVALWVDYGGDHGCGSNEVVLLRPPTTL